MTHPLSWDEARSLLRQVLENYLNDPPPPPPPVKKIAAPPANESFVSKAIRHNVDVYAALFLSVALLILASISLSARLNGNDNSLLRPMAAIAVYRAELAAAVLFVVASITGASVIRRRKFLSLNDSENAKRREIRKFLQASSKRETRKQATPSSPDNEPELVTLTAQTGVYPVYRRCEKDASWARIPSLLLVKGDWIALQIGDVAPACCSIEYDNRIIRVAAGERLTMETFGFTTDNVTEDLPRGRSTLPNEASNLLLTLCNKIEVFTVVDTPLEKFIRKPCGVPKSSQISRQIKAIRQSLFVVAMLLLAATAIITFSRSDASSGDITLVAHIPILAALGVLPVVGPAFLFSLEVLGTARILTTVHPYASTTRDVGESESRTRLLFRYILATSLSRLSLWSFAAFVRHCLRCVRAIPGAKRSKLVRIPPTSVNLLEKLGVATAFALVDDELVCEPQSIPQQLLVPSGKGLKLLDLCPAYEGYSDGESDSETMLTRKRGKSFDSDSDSEDGTQKFHSTLRRKVIPRRLRRKKSTLQQSENEAEKEPSRFDVQFEEPNWWQYLPSLKCIGLACLLLDDKESMESNEETMHNSDRAQGSSLPAETSMESAKSDLVELVCNERSSQQLRSLAECIGFTTEANSFGNRGDISAFRERLRLHLLSNKLFKERLALDAHERGSEWSRWWGMIRPDSTSVIVRDSRTKAYQLLTIGDPAIVVDLCNEAWQGEISTILPLAAIDRQTIIETTCNWKLADLDVTAFSYTPVPHTLETGLTAQPGSHLYLLDNTDHSLPLSRDKNISKEWSFIKNQVFLGVLASLIVPRKEIQKLLDVLSDAGVRFVYFSPRNMRRQKELAIQMGIDVAWNCAISLRPLESGEDDPHRMTSQYADWDVNAKLPHGVEDVRKHLEEVDNVPLLVSLFTDVSKATTKDMVEIFQEYHDTVISVGLSHLTRNEGIFACSDVAVGIDILTESHDLFSSECSSANVLSSELEFVSSISSHACAFRFRGAPSVSYISTIIEKSRASLEAAAAAGIFLVNGSLSFSFYVLFSVCVPSTILPFIPSLGSSIFLLVLLPVLGLSISMGDGDQNAMKQVPPKNDQKVAFGQKEGSLFYFMAVSKALLPALLPQILHLIAFGELLIAFEPEFVSEECPGAETWVNIVRCEGARDYTGAARTSAGVVVLSQFILCVIVASIGFVHRSASLLERQPWKSNGIWFCTIFVTLGLLVLYTVIATQDGTAAALPWYYYLLAGTTPFLCLFGVELCKRTEIKQHRRAEKLRRLQFETRLGAWSPR